MAGSKGLGIGNNYYLWPKNWKFEVGDFLFISLYVLSYGMQKKELFFKELRCIGNDGNDWGIDHGGQHMILLTNLVGLIIKINCDYHLLLWFFLSMCEVFFRNCVWALKRKRGEEKIAEMGGDLMRIEPAMIDDNMRNPLVWYLLKEVSYVSFMEALNSHDENFSM